MRRNVSTTAEILSFSAGALIGAGIALLYAPKTGQEMRTKVGDAAKDAITKMKEAAKTQAMLNSNLCKGRDYAEEKVSALSSATEESLEALRNGTNDQRL